ncbi:MAG: translation initiation inhibitor [Candidatus Hydrogenedentes bacterium]|nr:translation initiation inhibitor [Candidatus Hydrogenedentota bacterium]
MDFYSYNGKIRHASVNVSRFRGPSGVSEFHFVVRPTEYGAIQIQLEWLLHAYREALDSFGLDMQTAVLRRFFCSDLSNQVSALEACPFSNPRNAAEPCAVSWVCQPPFPPAKVALWAYHVSDPEVELDKTQEGASLTFRRETLVHHWTTGVTCPTGNSSYEQTRGILEQYNAFLHTRNLSLADNVLRTWFYVQDVDANYQGFVAARREFFAERGLTPDTHFIASSGIESLSTNTAAKVSMDAHAVSGVKREQLRYLAALDHLSPTHIYGVTFERGTSVAYQDRKQVILSGTASVDREGKILYPGEVLRQLDRTLENVEALLEQAGATVKDMCVFIVYVRDPSDRALVYQQMRERFGEMPIEVVAARVCRPGWLVEVEGKAIIPAANPELPPF